MQVQIAGGNTSENWGKVLPNIPTNDRGLRRKKTMTRRPGKEKFEVLLVAVGQTRDRAAFKVLFAHFAPRVKTYLMGFKLSGRAAEDLVQEVFLTIWRKAGMFDPAKAKASTWIFTIARNRMIDEKRKEKRFPADELKHISETTLTETGETKVLEKETRDRVHKALKKLPDDQREILEMAFLKGLTHSEIAEATGLALGTIKSRIRLAFEKMRYNLEN
jgi:RNA polymerase sigma-70 factor (ECF subfamily)